MSATGSNSPKLTYAQYKKRKTRRTVTVPLVVDDDAVLAYRVAEQALKDAQRRGDQAAAAEAEQNLAVADADVRAGTLLLRMRALPRDGYAALRAEHPPTADDDAEVQEATGNPKAKARWHSATFYPALVAATLTEPEVTVEQAAEMAADLNDAEWRRLWLSAVDVNEQATDTAGLVFS